MFRATERLQGHLKRADLGFRELRETTGMGESSPKVLDGEGRALSK
jgi:hypothetical protein